MRNPVLCFFQTEYFCFYLNYFTLKYRFIFGKYFGFYSSGPFAGHVRDIVSGQHLKSEKSVQNLLKLLDGGKRKLIYLIKLEFLKSSTHVSRIAVQCCSSFCSRCSRFRSRWSPDTSIFRPRPLSRIATPNCQVGCTV